MFEVNKMSATELKFIQTYVTALRKDYWLLQTAMELMKPDQLAVADIVQAARLSKAMQHMHAEFESTINALASTDRFFRRKTVKRPTLDELGDLFSLSFFKVVTTVKAGKQALSKHDDGWFSGDPYAWQNVFDNLQKNPPFNSLVTDCLKALAKMFPEMKDLHFGDAPPYDAPLNFWPGKQSAPEDDDYGYGEEDDENWEDDN
jgi:hypothetical protein